jgi:hypothetical protein
MNKIITKEQADAILAELDRLNVPIQTYKGIANLFNSLPNAEEEKPKK